MKKSTKGALAASAAGVLLLGGAGSLAYWTATGTVPGGSISSGELKIGTAACGDWLLDGGGTFTPATSKLVPGDTLTKVCTFPITASGDHLLANLSVNDPTFSGTPNALSTALTADATYTVGGVTATTIDSGDNGETLEATVSVEFPYDGPVSTPDPTTDADNTTQGLTAALNSVTVTAVQVQN